MDSIFFFKCFILVQLTHGLILKKIKFFPSIKNKKKNNIFFPSHGHGVKNKKSILPYYFQHYPEKNFYIYQLYINQKFTLSIYIKKTTK